MSMLRRYLNKQLLFRRSLIIMWDVLAIIASSFLALYLRYDFVFHLIDYRYLDAIWAILPYSIVTTVLVFYFLRLYHSLWNFAGVTEMENIFIACVVSSVLQGVGFLIMNHSIPRSYYFLYGIFLLFFTIVSRFLYRVVRIVINQHRANLITKNTMIVGGGAAANIIIKEIKTSRYTNHKNIKCIIDDAPEKQGMYIHGIRVVGNRDNIIEMVVRNDINEIIIAMPSATRKAVAEIVSICKETGCELRILPGIYQLMNGEVSVKKLRKVDIEDLLGRDTIKADMNSIASYVKDKVVLVTGGGGSIGSELCRQLATQEPKQLIILDIYENNAYAIQQELIRKYPNLNLLILISSVRDAIGLKQIFKKYQPDIVYHAAAHKHVPLMEDSPKEAIKNNVLGTLNAVVAAHLSGVQRFVMISTDKAVNPTNVMGASKRICEMIIQAYNKRSDTEFVAVRFGNVLGSNGSVIPLFRQQIEAGGPVTVTHPDIIRYFMTIPEAVTLVLQAGAYAKGGEIFVLDMGEPVKILDLAINLIRLSGYEPYEEISIEFTGLRPGEKLYEEMLMDEEGMTSTENHMIFIGKPINFDESRFFQQIEELKVASHTETSDIRKLIKEIVPGYMDGDTNENKLKDFLIQSNKDKCLIN